MFLTVTTMCTTVLLYCVFKHWGVHVLVGISQMSSFIFEQLFVSSCSLQDFICIHVVVYQQYVYCFLSIMVTYHSEKVNSQMCIRTSALSSAQACMLLKGQHGRGIWAGVAENICMDWQSDTFNLHSCVHQYMGLVAMVANEFDSQNLRFYLS